MYSDQIDFTKIETIYRSLPKITEDNVESILDKKDFSIADFPILISPIATKFIEIMARKAQKITRERFGNTIQLYAPLYLSNYCENQCVYCGYNSKLKYPRIQLTDNEILEEAKILKAKGFQHILLLTGEAPHKTNLTYIANAVKMLNPLFSSICLEIYPLETNEYEILIENGADSLTIYQETYNRNIYKQVHLAGKKADFNFRLNTPDRAGKANFAKITLGALLGLADFRWEALNLAAHLDYLKKNYWQIEYAISVPRIKKIPVGFMPLVEVTDLDITQLILAFRLCFKDIGINLSTRESALLRDNLINLGVTAISAESKTNPGGYAGKNNLTQFETADNRNLAEIKKMLIKNNLEPVFKNWDKF